MTDLSIIIPTYNRLWALPKAVDSGFFEGRKVEVVVVDDGSTDGTREWLEDRKDVVSIRQDNWGKDWAVAAGVAAAQGEYIRFLDDDDWLEPRANAEQLALARETGADIVVAGYQDYYEDGDRQEPHPWVDCDDFVAQQFGEVSYSHYSAFLFRRAFIPGHPASPGIRAARRPHVRARGGDQGTRLAVYRQPAFVHRHHRGSRLQRHAGFRRSLAEWTTIEVYRKATSLLEKRGELTPRRRRAAAAQIWPVVRNLAKTQLDEAARGAEWIATLDPGFRAAGARADPVAAPTACSASG